MPEGADAVVQVEDTQVIDDGKKVRILKAVSKGHDIRPVVILLTQLSNTSWILQSWRMDESEESFWKTAELHIFIRMKM